MYLRGIVHDSTCRLTLMDTVCEGTRHTCRKLSDVACENWGDGECKYVEGHTACQGHEGFCPDIHTPRLTLAHFGIHPPQPAAAGAQR